MIDKKYLGEMIINDEGQTLSGFIEKETGDTITIRSANNQVTTLQQDDIEVRRAMNNSFMPTGLERTMSKQHLVDLLEYLMTQR